MGMDEHEAWQEAQMEEFAKKAAEDAIEDIKSNAISYHFFYYGADIERRVSGRIAASKELTKLGFYGEALTSAYTSIELTIRWCFVRPLCQASFLEDEIADVVVSHILPKHSASRDRDLFPKLMEQWKLDVDAIQLPSGKGLWASLKGQVIPARNRFVHRSNEIDKTTAELGVEVAEVLFQEAIKMFGGECNSLGSNSHGKSIDDCI